MTLPIFQQLIDAKAYHSAQDIAVSRLADPKTRLRITETIKQISSLVGLIPKRTSSTNNNAKPENHYTLLDLNGSICLPHVAF